MTLLERSATTSYNTLPRHPGRLRDNFSRLLEYLHLLFHPHGTPHPRGVRCNERCDVSPRDISVPGQLQALPPVLDSSPTNNSDYTSHHYPVGDVQSPKLSSSKLCESFGQKDLGIVGSCPIDAGGSADVWLGERNGETVAIKSYRHNASSDRFIVYLVSGECRHNTPRPLNVTGRGTTRRPQHIATSTAATRTSYASLAYIRLQNTHFASSSSIWPTLTSESS